MGCNQSTLLSYHTFFLNNFHYFIFHLSGSLNPARKGQPNLLLIPGLALFPRYHPEESNYGALAQEVQNLKVGGVERGVGDNL